MNAIRIIECEQGTPEWHKARAGIPTASRFWDISRKLKSGNYSDLRETYMYELAGERITEEIAETYDGGALARGHAMEDEARRLYEFMNPDLELKRIGFVINDVWRAGASPDSFIGEEGGLEIKSKKPKFHIQVIVANAVPEDHLAQVQGTLGITGRAWWDFESYWPKMRPFIARVPRDELYIARLKGEIDKFNQELDALVRKLTI